MCSVYVALSLQIILIKLLYERESFVSWNFSLPVTSPRHARTVQARMQRFYRKVPCTRVIRKKKEQISRYLKPYFFHTSAKLNQKLDHSIMAFCACELQRCFSLVVFQVCGASFATCQHYLDNFFPAVSEDENKLGSNIQSDCESLHLGILTGTSKLSG